MTYDEVRNALFKATVVWRERLYQHQLGYGPYMPTEGADPTWRPLPYREKYGTDLEPKVVVR